MKHFYIIIIICLYSQFGYSQNSNSNFGTDQTNFKNELSLETLQLINGLYQITYERYIWNNFTASLGFGYKGKEGLFRISELDGRNIQTGEIFYTGYQIIPEVRYYLRKTTDRTLSGFYFGAYLKYSNYNSDLNGHYTSSDNTHYDLAFEMGVDITSIGFMVGYKLPLSKHFNIDFLIAGPGTGHYNFRFKNSQDLPDEFYDDLNNLLEDYSILDLINSDFRFSKIDNSSKFSALSFRYGIAIGYTF
ncbi:DUF3575 domain-containing protein [Formosa haliotis]|uniref:DUF3575 domain-containing protein n=1 Tax=Formosa haliotis TaxID=1555194 RepID=UPI0008243928|nr:DUF3575 domain-containing protein [Formosa haliotis]